MAISHSVGFDDCPFPREHRGDVRIVGAVCAGARLEGIVSDRVRRDGANSTSILTRLVQSSRYSGHLQLVLLQGIALAGFNVVDVPELHSRTGLPILVVARRAPRLEAIREALLTRVAGGARKWKLIEKLGPMEPLEGVFVQRAGLGQEEAGEVLRRLAVNGRIPEPLRIAHLVAGGIATGESTGRT